MVGFPVAACTSHAEHSATADPSRAPRWVTQTARRFVCGRSHGIPYAPATSDADAEFGRAARRCTTAGVTTESLQTRCLWTQTCVRFVNASSSFHVLSATNTGVRRAAVCVCVCVCVSACVCDDHPPSCDAAQLRTGPSQCSRALMSPVCTAQRLRACAVRQ